MLLLEEVILWKYNATPGEDFAVERIGLSETITRWEIVNEPPPGLQEIAAWLTDPAFQDWRLSGAKESAQLALQKQREDARGVAMPLRDYLQEVSLMGKLIQSFVFKTLKQAVPTWEPQPEMFPALFGLEAHVLRLSPEEMADRAIAEGLEGLRFNDAVDGLATGVNQAIEDAESIEEVRAIITSIGWPRRPSQR